MPGVWIAMWGFTVLSVKVRSLKAQKVFSETF